MFFTSASVISVLSCTDDHKYYLKSLRVLHNYLFVLYLIFLWVSEYNSLKKCFEFVHVVTVVLILFVLWLFSFLNACQFSTLPFSMSE